MNNPRTVSLLSLLCVAISSFSNADGIRPGASFPAPDRQHSVSVVEIDRQWRYAIKDELTGEVDNSTLMPTVLVYLHWAANSQSIIAVEHIAQGSIGRVLYLKSGKWSNVEVAPPPASEWQRSSVVELQLWATQVHYRFAVTRLKGSGKPATYKFLDVDVNLDSGEITNQKWTSSNQAEVVASLQRKPSYDPPMEE